MVEDKKEDDVNPDVIKAALRGIRMPMTIEVPEARVLQFLNDFFSRLEGAG